MTASPPKSEKDTLVTALLAVQQALKPIVKDKTASTEQYAYAYADLAAVLEAILPVANAHGITVLQAPSYDAERRLVSVTTKLWHRTGETWDSQLSMPSPKDTPQGIGTAISYCRRYALVSIFSLPQLDTDAAEHEEAHTAEQRPVTRERLQRESGEAKSGKGSLISEAQARRLYALTKDAGRDPDDVADYLQKEWGYNSSREIEWVNYDKICAWVQGVDEDTRELQVGEISF